MNQIILTQFKDFKEQLNQQLTNYFPENSTIAIKLHMGELGNKYFLKPEYAKLVIDVCNELKLKPFLFDTPTLYRGPRNLSKGYYLVAMKHGFTKIGKVKISNESIKVKGNSMDYNVAETLTEADGVIVLTHYKGHANFGAGDSIKNLAMGSVDKETKGKIHNGGKPVYTGNCQLCGECVKACPQKNIRLNDSPYFDQTSCWGCSNCILACKFNALKPKVNYFHVLMIESANSVLDNIKKIFYINVIKDVTKECDCAVNTGGIIAKDIGIVMGKDILSVDKSSFDLIKKNEGEDIFYKHHKISPLLHLKEAEKQLGKMKYKLKEI